MLLLALSGSLRAASRNTSLLRAAALLAPAGVEIPLYERLGDLPYFNPDLDVEPAPEPVADFRVRLRAAEGVVICSPEYAHGVAGVMKNALDWLVSDVDFVGKPIALINAAPFASHSDASMREILKTMSANIVQEASCTVPIAGRVLDANGIITDPVLAEPLRNALAAFVRAIHAGDGSSGHVTLGLTSDTL